MEKTNLAENGLRGGTSLKTSRLLHVSLGKYVELTAGVIKGINVSSGGQLAWEYYHHPGRPCKTWFRRMIRSSPVGRTTKGKASLYLGFPNFLFIPFLKQTRKVKLLLCQRQLQRQNYSNEMLCCNT